MEYRGSEGAEKASHRRSERYTTEVLNSLLTLIMNLYIYHALHYPPRGSFYILQARVDLVHHVLARPLRPVPTRLRHDRWYLDIWDQIWTFLQRRTC